VTGLIIAVAVTVFLSVALLLLLFSGRSVLSKRLAQVAAVQVPTPIEDAPDNSIAKVFGIVGPIRKWLGLSEDTELAKRLSLAGYREPWHSDVYYGFRLVLPVVGAVTAAFALSSDQMFWFFALAALGFFVPDFWLHRAITQRREKIRLSLPDALDLLVICMEAGLGMDQALIRVGQELRIPHPELSEEFLLINLEQRAGKPRIEAWRNMGERTGLEVVRGFVNMLVQTERFGTPISRSLGNFADALRLKRRQKAEEQAAKTTIKLIFPLVLFIFPSMFIVLLAPAVISISKTLDEVFR